MPVRRQRGRWYRCAEKKTVKRDDAGEREQGEDIRRGQAQQGRQDRTFEQQLGARRRGREKKWSFRVPMMAAKLRRFGRS